jgi:predicted permease
MIRDVKFAIRRLFQTPAFTISAVAVLALGIGANTAVFNLVHTMFFAAPAFAEPTRLVQVFSQDRKNPKAFRSFSYPTYRDVRDRNDVFGDAMAFDLALVGLGQVGDIRRTFAATVSSNYFSVLGVQPVRGRVFLPEEETPGRPAEVAIVSYAYWQKHNLDPAVLGSRILINGHPFTIVGIAPKGFTGTMQVFSIEVYTPLSTYDLMANDFDRDDRKALGDRTGQHLMIVGRFKPGLTAAAAKLRLEGLAANLESAFPVEQKDQTFATTPIPRLSVSSNPSNESDFQTLSVLLLGMSAVVLIVACLNLANMLLARGIARRKEIAIRLAVGGSRGQIVRQLLTEGFVLAVAGGAAGLVVGLWSSSLMVASMNRLLPFDIVWTGGANGSMLLATLAFCTAATLVFALGPALTISRPTVAADLKEHSAEDAGRRRWRWIPGHPLVVIQIAFSLALLTAAALFIRGAGKAAGVDTGLQPGASFLAETDASLAGYNRERAQHLYDRLAHDLSALPGVERVAISATVPFGMLSLSKNVQRAGIQAAPGSYPSTAAEGLAFNASWNSISADYFETVGLPMLRGRAFSEGDAARTDSAPVAIIDDALARKLWPDGDAIGQYIQYASSAAPVAKNESNSVGMNGTVNGDAKSAKGIQIVGIVPTTRHALFEKTPPGQIYVPFSQGFQTDISYFVRFRSLSRATEPTNAELIRRTIRQEDSALPILSLRTFDEHLDNNLALWLVRAGATLFTIFGVLALVLAVVGLYGVKAYSVARRTREIGIRMALGAQGREVLGMLMREGSMTLLSGIGLGVLLSIATAKIVSGLVYEVGWLDPIAFTAAPLLLGLAAVVATWVPARRAMRVSPLEALRLY